MEILQDVSSGPKHIFSIVLAARVWGHEKVTKAQSFFYRTRVINSVLFIVHLQRYTPAQFTEEFAEECKGEVFVSRSQEDTEQ